MNGQFLAGKESLQPLDGAKGTLGAWNVAAGCRASFLVFGQLVEPDEVMVLEQMTSMNPRRSKEDQLQQEGVVLRHGVLLDDLAE